MNSILLCVALLGDWPVPTKGTVDPLARLVAQRTATPPKATPSPDSWFRFHLKGYEVAMLGHYEDSVFVYDMGRQPDFVRYLYGYPQGTYRAAVAAPNCVGGNCPR